MGRQPPSGGCVLKQKVGKIHFGGHGQPPSGGCVLKHIRFRIPVKPDAAAFRRLCVETLLDDTAYSDATGSRLQAAVC